MERKNQNKCRSLHQHNYQLMRYKLYPDRSELVDDGSDTRAVGGDGLSGNVLVCFRTAINDQ
jgi:hypothetical protein